MFPAKKALKIPFCVTGFRCQEQFSPRIIACWRRGPSEIAFNKGSTSNPNWISKTILNYSRPGNYPIISAFLALNSAPPAGSCQPGNEGIGSKMRICIHSKHRWKIPAGKDSQELHREFPGAEFTPSLRNSFFISSWTWNSRLLWVGRGIKAHPVLSQPNHSTVP